MALQVDALSAAACAFGAIICVFLMHTTMFPEALVPRGIAWAIIATSCWLYAIRRSVRCQTFQTAHGFGPDSPPDTAHDFGSDLDNALERAIWITPKGAKYHVDKGCRGLAGAHNTPKKYLPCDICARAQSDLAAH